MSTYGEQGDSTEQRFGSLDVMSRLFDSLDLTQDGMRSRDELLDGLQQQGVDKKAIATLQKAIDALQQAIVTDGVVSKEGWKALLERAAPALQAAAAAAAAAARSAGNAALELAGIVDILNIVHKRPANADFAQLHQWKSLRVTRGHDHDGDQCLTFCSTEAIRLACVRGQPQQFGWPV
jgi:hypothetical protein